MKELIFFLGLAIIIATVSAQDPIVTIVNSDPIWIETNFDKVIRAQRDKDITMDCTVENLPQETYVRWQKEYTDDSGRTQVNKISEDAGVEDNTKYSIDKPSRYTWRLRIRNAAVTDEGTFVCSVQVTKQTFVKAIMQITVLLSPILNYDVTSTDLVVKERDNVDLICDAEGRPTPTFEWTRLGNQLLPIGKERHLGREMSILNVKPQDRGDYVCRIFNIMGSLEWYISLDVLFPPMINMRKEVFQAVGYRIELQCLIESNPFPREEELSWVKNQGARKFTASAGNYIIKKIEGAFNQLTYELIFTSVREEDFGDYQCKVKNSEGESTGVISLIKSETPQASLKLGEVVTGGASSLLFALSTLLTCLVTFIFHSYE